jgi:hypothetical protein
MNDNRGLLLAMGKFKYTVQGEDGDDGRQSAGANQTMASQGKTRQTACVIVSGS